MERWHFRAWDRRSFVQAHAQAYHHSTVRAARLRERACFSAHDELFLEFVRVERLVDDAPPEGAWFAELLRLGLLGDAPSEVRRRGCFAQVRLDWLREWGYLDRNRE